MGRAEDLEAAAGRLAKRKAKGLTVEETRVVRYGKRRPRRPYGSIPFGERQILAKRAFEVAKSLGLPEEVTLETFQESYRKATPRRKARLDDPVYLRARLEELEREGK